MLSRCTAYLAAKMPRTTPRPEQLLDERSYTPRLRVTEQLPAAPPEIATEARLRAPAVWQALLSAPEELIADRVELAKADRALVAARKQLMASKAETAAARADVARVAAERFSPSVVYGLGAAALLCLGGWVHQRRRLLALHQQQDPVTLRPLAGAGPAAFARAAEPTSVSVFDDTDMQAHDDESAEWLARARLPVPGAEPPQPSTGRP
jgi:hypothetical protein